MLEQVSAWFWNRSNVLPVGQTDVVKHSYSGEGKQRYRCRTADCLLQTLIRHYADRGSLPEVKQQIADMAMNGSGIRDTARVLGVSPTTVIEPLKKTPSSPASQYASIGIGGAS
ncbi:MAG: IS1-like element transposase [Cyanobacteria bacterium P01_G01_bin.4]